MSTKSSKTKAKPGPEVTYDVEKRLWAVTDSDGKLIGHYAYELALKIAAIHS